MGLRRPAGPSAASRWGIRAQLLVLVVAALLPLVAYVAWTMYEEQQAWGRHLTDEAASHAERIGATLENHLHFVEGVMGSVAPLAAGGALPKKDVDAIISRLPPYITNLMVYDVSGRLTSSHLEPSPELLQKGAGDRAYFRDALKTDDMVVSEPIVGKITGSRVVNTALAFRNADHAVAGVIVATTNLATFEAAALTPMVTPDMTMAVFHENRLELTTPRQAATLREAQAQDELRHAAFYGALSVSNEARAFASRRLKRVPWTVAVVLDADYPVHEKRWQLLAAGAAALAFALIAALALARRITQPLAVLEKAAHAIGRGDLGHRVPLLGGDAGVLGIAFNTMTGQIDTQRRRLAADEQRFRAAFHGSPLAMIVVTMDSMILEANAAFCALQGITPAQAIGRTTLDLGVWQDPAQRELFWEELRRAGRVERFALGVRAGANRFIDVLLFAETIEVDGRQLVMAQFVDVTDALRAEQLRFESEEWLRAVFRHNPLATALMSLETGEFVRLNHAFTKLFGYTAQQLVGRTAAELGIWQELDERDAFHRRIRDEGAVEAFEAGLRTRAGDVREVLLFGERIQLDAGRMVVVQVVDNTERHHAERRLKDVSDRLRLATRAARIGIWNLDLLTRRLEPDSTSLELLGIAPGEFHGRDEDFLRSLHPEDREAIEHMNYAIEKGNVDGDVDFRIVRPDGAVRHMRSSVHVERDANGNALRLVGTCRDITESVQGRATLARMNAELESRVAERTAQLQAIVRELEAFSYTVAHDLRAPLRAIDGFTAYLHGSIGAPGEEAGAFIAKIRRNVSAMERLIDGLLDYARLGRQSLRAVGVDMGALAADAAATVMGEYAAVQLHIAQLPTAYGDAGMLRQVWANLIGNACKFSRGRPGARVEVGATRDEQGVVFFVRDNGVGFDMQYADRLFRVFERLHNDPAYGGSGVGLAMVQRILQRHGGSVWTQAREGEGAVFFFRLPAAVESAQRLVEQ